MLNLHDVWAHVELAKHLESRCVHDHSQQDGLLSSMAFLGRPGNCFMCSKSMTENIGKKEKRLPQGQG